MYKKLLMLFLTLIISFVVFMSCTDDDNTTTPTPDPKITITSPNGGETWYTGTTQTITWEDNIDGNVRIILGAGEAFFLISLDTESDGVFEYDIPEDIPEDNIYKVLVSALEPDSVYDFTDMPFEILAAP